VRAQLKDGTEVVLPEGAEDNKYLARADNDKDLIILDDDVVALKVDEEESERGERKSLPPSRPAESAPQPLRTGTWSKYD
jgi:hypothetical protein